MRAVLVGREKEQLALEEVLEDARGSRGRVLALVGEPGIGKSSLLAHAEQQAEGMQLLRARGVQSETQVPFAGLSELLRPALSAISSLPPPQVAALESALALRPAGSADRFAIGSATLSLLAAFAERSPLLVLVDDAHWLDGSSADALRFAARRLVADPIALVVAVREDEPSLLDGADLPRLVVRGLDRAAAGELVRSLGRVSGGSGEVVDRLYAATGGNPLALVELAGQEGSEPGTPLNEPVPVTTSVAKRYISRYRDLPDRSRRLLVLVAASDTDELGLLARAARALGVDLADVEPAEAAGLVALDGSRVEWRHPLARSAVYAGAAAPERRAAHRALADVLPDADSDRRAWHLALAVVGPDATASSALEQAGLRARERSAYDVASRAFERAAVLSSEPGRRARLLHASADAAWLGGLADRAAQLLEQARSLPADAEVEVSVTHLRGYIAARRGAVDVGRALLLEAADRAMIVDAPRATMIYAEALYAAFYAGKSDAVQQAAARVSAVASTCTDARSTFFASMAGGIAMVLRGEGDCGPRLIRAAVRLLDASAELRDDPTLLAWAVTGPLFLREVSADDAVAERALAAARGRSAAGVLPFVLAHVGTERAARDRWSEAQAAFYEAIDISRETGQHAELAMCMARLAWLEARQGSEQSCREHALEALELARQHGLGATEVWALGALGDLELGMGRAVEALERFEEQRARLQQLGIDDVDPVPGPELVEVYLRTGRVREAAELAAQFRRAADAKGQPWVMSRALRAQGLVAADDAIAPCFGEALHLHEQTPDIYETARTYLAYGGRLRRARRRVAARRELRAAIEIFDQLGAQPWAESARRELAATGETVSPRVQAKLTRLTAQELQIAVLLSDGRTTRQAAAALFVSPKTIEFHQRSVYRKLGVSSREELAAAMTGMRSV
jgi:DNA-binding CsgD family transcriptional regulator